MDSEKTSGRYPKLQFYKLHLTRHDEGLERNYKIPLQGFDSYGRLNC